MAGERARLAEIEARLANIEVAISQPQAAHFPGGPIVDPGPFPWPQPWPQPRPLPIPWPQPRPLPIPWPLPWPGDPAPIDLSRFSGGQLDSMLHSIHSERARLDSMEKMVKDSISAMKKKK